MKRKKNWLQRQIIIVKERMIEKRWYNKLTQYTIPSIKSYFNKIIYIALWGVVYLLALRLLGYTLTLINLLSAIAVYLLVEQMADYLLKLRKGR